MVSLYSKGQPQKDSAYTSNGYHQGANNMVREIGINAIGIQFNKYENRSIV